MTTENTFDDAVHAGAAVKDSIARRSWTRQIALMAPDWGVYGVPETFAVDVQGRIAYKQIGPITAAIWNQTLLPLIRARQAGSP